MSELAHDRSVGVMGLVVDERTVAMVAVCDAAIVWAEAVLAFDDCEHDPVATVNDMMVVNTVCAEAGFFLIQSVNRLLPFVTVPANGEAT